MPFLLCWVILSCKQHEPNENQNLTLEYYQANGKLMVIDGGFSKAYHNETGIAGYTLVYHSRGFQLVQHEPFTSAEDAITRGTDIKSTTQIVEMSNRRMLVADTDIGQDLRKQIEGLQELLYAYRHGYIKETERKK